VQARTRLAAVTAATVAALAGVGLLTAGPATAVDTRTPWTLAAVAQECARTATAGKPGVVEIASRLTDANAKVTITVPCIVHLVNGASVSLANVTLTTKALNIHDRATGVAPSVVDIAGSTITAVGNDAGVLVELDDAADRINIARTTVTAPAGFLARAADLRGEVSSGGSVTMASSTVTANGPSTGGIQVLASEQGGRVAVTETTLDTTGPLTVLAGTCSATRAGQVLNCSADQVARGLG
jgi:hypothetical protein